MVMDYLQAGALAIVEGITEFLPISSTGHLVLTANLLKIAQSEFVKSFEIIIQMAAILAVLVLSFGSHRSLRTWSRIIAAFIPTAIVGFVFYKFIKETLLGNINITLAALFLGGVAFIVFEKIYKEQKYHVGKIEDLSLTSAFLIGIAQSVSVIPGVSRAGASIFGGLFAGLTRSAAVEFSFLLAIPTMFAAVTLDLIKTNLSFSGQEYLILGIGFAGAFVSATAAVKYFLQFIKRHNFVGFGIYRIVFAVIYFILVQR